MQKYNFSHIILFLLVTLTSGVINAQEKGLIFSKYYSPTDYQAAAQNWCVAEDQRGVMYFGNGLGILEYDGETWRYIETPNNSAVRSLAFDKNNTLFVGAYNRLGYLEPDQSGELKYKSLNHLIDSSHIEFGDIWDIYCFDDTVFFLCDNYLFRYSNNKFDYWESEKDRFYLSHRVNGSFLVQEMGKGLLKLEKDSLFLIENGDFFADIRIHNILPFDKDLLICTRTKGLYLYSISENKIIPFSNISAKTRSLNNYFIENIFYHGIEITDSTYAFSTIAGTILILDKKLNVIDLIDSETIGIKTSIHYLYHQKNQSLWLALGNGICQVEILSPFRYWNDDQGIYGNLTDVAKLNNNLYLSTASGVYVTNSEKTSDFELSTFDHIEGTFEQAWGFLYFQPPSCSIINTLLEDSRTLNRRTNDETLLLVSSSRGLFQINEKKSHQISDIKTIYTSYQYKKDPSVLFLGLTHGVAMLSYKNEKWENHGLKYNNSDIIRGISEDTLGNLWLSAEYKGLYRIENPLSEKPIVEFFDTTNNLPATNSIQIINYQDTLFFLSNYEYYTFNPELKLFELYEVPRDTSSNEDKSIDTLYLSLNRLAGEVLSNNFYITEHDDPYQWFGSTKGTCRYNNAYHRDFFDISPTIIRKVLAKDSIVYNGTNYSAINSKQNNPDLTYILNPDPVVDIGTVMEYKDNSLTFFFANPYFEDEEKNKYSYFLQGFDKDWSEWTGDHKKEYMNLGVGDYIFKVKSINLYENESPVAEFKFTVLPPWYRTFGAFIGYGIIGTLIIILIVKLYTYRLIREKDKLEKIVIERTQEILMQKEEILVQAEHLKDANEEIVARNEKLEVQKQEIETQRDELAVSNATKNKFFRIIAHDLRNPISTLAGSTNLIFNAFDDYDKTQTKVFMGELNKLSQTTYNLLENLLDWSSTQMGQLRFLPKIIDLKSLTEENIELISQKIDSKKIDLSVNVEKNTHAFADENMVKTIIRNLLSNAVKFTPENGKIEISCELKDETISYSVKDSGIGIKKDDLQKLFRIDSHHSTPGLSNEKGSGLGLILCKEFVQKNGGKIMITSEPEKGTRIEFTLNRNQASKE